ncbi:MAG: hypothetical protein D6696_01810 [Acidobacteria bacterium]|nr:MAG: hypothetical protein D6696_01810 [Acidobacteriota bacterium]
MSLKAFHVVFVVVATLLMTGFGVWSLRHATGDGAGTSYLVMGGLALVAAIALVVYGVWFLKKTKGVSYL